MNTITIANSTNKSREENILFMRTIRDWLIKLQVTTAFIHSIYIFRNQFIGNLKINTEPSPSELSTLISPFIIRQNFRLIAKPSPVPPKRRVTEESA